MSAILQASREESPLTIALRGTKFKEQVSLALPKHLTADRFTRTALTALNKNPKLLDCTPESIFKCLYDLAALGIEADGRRAHLIPYGKECQLILDYKGIAELVRRSGEVSTIHCDVVYPKDDFELVYGTGGRLVHKPVWGDRGTPILVYSYVKMKDGGEEYDAMDMEAVNVVRSRSRSKDSGPWVTDYLEMAKKTVFRRHSKWLPLSAELREKIERDDEPLTHEERFAKAKPVFAPSTPFSGTASETPTTEAKEPAGEPVKKPRGKAEKQDPPPAADDTTLHGRLHAAMARFEITSEEVVQVAVTTRLADPCPYTTPIEECISEKAAEAILSDWEPFMDAVGSLRKHKGKTH